MKPVISSVVAEFRRYKALADASIDQLSDLQLSETGSGAGNSVSVMVWHLGGNLASRFTDFLDSDGEKPWRQREEEFVSRAPARGALLDHWERGWEILFDTLAALTDDQLQEIVLIRGTELRVHEALHRSLAHASYHVGQIVFLARALRGEEWRFLSIPPGGSEEYNENPTSEHGDAHASRLKDED